MKKETKTLLEEAEERYYSLPEVKEAIAQHAKNMARLIDKEILRKYLLKNKT